MSVDKMNDKNGHIVVFSGYNQRAVISFLRTLEKNRVNYSIIALPTDDTINLSDYRCHINAVRRTKKLDFADICSCLEQVKAASKADNLWIAPSTEALNRFLLENRSMLETMNCMIPLVDVALYSRISDKFTFGELCREHGILTPEQSEQLADISVPFVAKPYAYYSKNGDVFSPQLILSNLDKEAFVNDYKEDDFFYQRFILGDSLYLLYYFGKCGNVYKYSQRNIAQQPNGKSIIAAEPSNVHNEPIASQYEKMLNSLRFRGLIMIEIRKHDGQYYMIEANPRFWGPSQMFVDANMNIFEAMLHDCGFLRKNPDFTNPVETRYYWIGGFKQVANEHLEIVYHTNEAFVESDWERYDIYNRPDTLEIFKEEIR